MRYPAALALALLFLVGSHGLGGDAGCYYGRRDCVLKRFSPAGGWHPDCGGLLNWWRPDCFPRCGGPDDYCRKPLPCVCRPSYAPAYVSPRPCCTCGTAPGYR